MTDRHSTAHPAKARTRLRLAAGALLLALVGPWNVSAATTYPWDSGSPDGFEGSYSYVRVLEGSATLIQGDTGDRDQVQVNQPILAGDRLWVAPRGRVEVVLSDHNLLRIDAGSEVVFDALAGSPDRNDPATILRIPQGNVQLVVVSDFLGEGLPRVDTPNATVYAHDFGTYRITTDAGDWTELVAREGSAEVVTRGGSLRVGSGEEAVVEGERDPAERVSRAGRLDSLEAWGERLDREARYASVPYVDDSIRYEAATLDRYGSWVTLEGRYAWRPRVGSDWRPYWNGRWTHSPLGYTWISHEPWGWVPYHYGTWDYVPSYGWAWFPGARFAPAWVYWYWTDAYVGWVPTGYYTHHYRSFFDVGLGFRFGVYGWTGGHWSHYQRWNFCDLRYFGGGRQHHYVHRGDRFGDHVGQARPRRGILTTDTRGVPRLSARSVSARGDEIVRTLAERSRPAKGDLPDMTAFVAREREIGREVRERIAVPRDAAKGRSAPIVLADETPRGPKTGDRSRQIDRTGRGETITGARTRRPDTIDRGEREAGADRGAADRTRSIDSIRRSLPNVQPRPGVGAGDRDTPSRDILRVDPEDRRGAGSVGHSATPPDRTGNRGAAERSWRDRAPTLPERPSRIGVERRIDRGGDRTRSDRLDRSSSGRVSVPRRVIEGVRSNDRSSRRPSSIDRDAPRPDRSRSIRQPSSSPRTRSSSPRTRSSSPPPRRSSGVSSRSGSSQRGSSVSSRSRSSNRSSSVSSRSSASRSRSSSGARSRSGSSSRSSGSSKGSARSRGNKPPL